MGRHVLRYLLAFCASELARHFPCSGKSILLQQAHSHAPKPALWKLSACTVNGAMKQCTKLLGHEFSASDDANKYSVADFFARMDLGERHVQRPLSNLQAHRLLGSLWPYSLMFPFKQ